MNGSFVALYSGYVWYMTACALLSLLVCWRLGESRVRGLLAEEAAGPSPLVGAAEA